MIVFNFERIYIAESHSKTAEGSIVLLSFKTNIGFSDFAILIVLLYTRRLSSNSDVYFRF